MEREERRRPEEDNDGELDDLEFECEFKQAVIKIAGSLPDILKTINDHTKSMDEFASALRDLDWPDNKTLNQHILAMRGLTNSINNMPHSLRVHP